MLLDFKRNISIKFKTLIFTEELLNLNSHAPMSERFYFGTNFMENQA